MNKEIIQWHNPNLFKSLFQRVWNKIENLQYIPFEIKCFFQRGMRGWSDKDWWSCDYYVANIMIGCLSKFKTEGHILPTWKEGMLEKQAIKKWHRILDDIIYTFEIVKGVADSDIYLIEDKKHRRSMAEIAKKSNKKHPEYPTKVLTVKEIKKYKKGWKKLAEVFTWLSD